MKKILSFLTAGLLALTMFSCSTDMHDLEPVKHEPVTISGAKWYYYDITVFGDNDGSSANLIVDNGTQSTDTVMPAFTAADGGALYFTAASTVLTDGKFSVNTSYQSDNPAYTAVPGTIRVYVYTDLASPNLYYWGADKAFKAASWPGNAMTVIGETLPSIKIAGISVKNLTSSVASKGEVIAFMEGWLPNNAWDITTPNKAFVTADDSGNLYCDLTFTTAVETTSGTFKVQPRVVKDVAKLWDGTGAKINGNGDYTATITIDSNTKNKTYIWTLDVSTSTASLVEKTN